MPSRQPASPAHHRCGAFPGNGDAHAARLDSREATNAIRGLAERQHGVVARRQLLWLGMSAELVDGRLAAGLLIPVHEGVFAVGHARVTRRGRWLAAVLATGPRSVLSHGSAAELWDIRRSRGWPEVTRRSGGTARPGVRVHQTRVLEQAETTIEAGIPVTSIERTLLDIAASLDIKQLEQAVVAADRTGRLRWQELDRLLVRTLRRPGAPRLRQVAHRVSPNAVNAKSPPEVDFLALCREAGLHEPHVNVLVGPYQIDFLWPGERVVVETDSYAFHRDRLAFEEDRKRTLALTADGYEVHRVTALMLESDPKPFIRLLRRCLHQRGASPLRGNSPQQ
jgi:very-short-patch-repair endonuclease